MLKFKKVELTREEKILIKRIARIQIESLDQILAGDPDILLDVAGNGVSTEQFLLDVSHSRERFLQVKKNPYKAFSLGLDDRGMIRHIIFNFFDNNKYAEPRAKIWKKLNLLDDLSLNLN